MIINNIRRVLVIGVLLLFTGWITNSWQTKEVAAASPLACGDSATFIHDIQGTGDISPLSGATVTIEGVVVGEFQSTLNGFFVQEEDSDIDSIPSTSEGIFIYYTDCCGYVGVGDFVRVTGRVSEYYGLTELSYISSIEFCGGTPTASPTTINLPVADLADWEHYEGMSVYFPQTLSVTEEYRLGRWGEISLSAGGRLMNPTNVVSPGVSANTMQESNNRHRILLDDGALAQNPDPIKYPSPGLSASNTVRGGDTVTGLVGILTYSWSGWSGTDAYRVHPTTTPNFVPANPRPTSPPSVLGSLTVASFNVLNYFNGDGMGGGFPTSRGANTASEFTRQRDKIINALVTMDADIVGLMEIENDGYGSYSAIQDLVNGLNTSVGSGSYSFVDPDVSQIGTDDIAVGFIYKTRAVSLVGSAAILDDGFDSNYHENKNRPALAQTFQEISTGEIFTIVVNHLKSKGSACDDIGDPDLGDGQGNCNQTRTDAVTVEMNWILTDPTGSGDPDFLIIGDMNSYNMEDPITTFEAGSYTDLAKSMMGINSYTYVFDGQWGNLDHAFANSSLLSAVTGIANWRINSDEPSSLDYNEEYKSSGQISSLYSSDMYRASDHDPVMIGIDFSLCAAPSSLTDATIINTGNDILLTWSDVGAFIYDIYRSVSPYFTPDAGNWYSYSDTHTSYQDIGTASTSGTAYYYFLTASNSCGTRSIPSTQMGVFNFSMQPGT